jgi:hypothetical protein
VNPTSPAGTVLDEVITWAGITTQPTPRGAAAILFEGHELGHVHANRGTLDLGVLASTRGFSGLMMGRAGIEPATLGLKVRPDNMQLGATS